MNFYSRFLHASHFAPLISIFCIQYIFSIVWFFRIFTCIKDEQLFSHLPLPPASYLSVVSLSFSNCFRFLSIYFPDAQVILFCFVRFWINSFADLTSALPISPKLSIYKSNLKWSAQKCSVCHIFVWLKCNKIRRARIRYTHNVNVARYWSHVPSLTPFVQEYCVDAVALISNRNHMFVFHYYDLNSLQ